MLKHIPFYGSLLGRELVDGKKSTNSHVLIYGAIEAHSFGERGCIASNKTIASETGLTEGTVASALSVIGRAGWVQIDLDDKNHRTLITPLLTIEPPLSGGYTPLERGLNPPLVATKHRIHLDNIKETAEKPIVAGKMIDANAMIRAISMAEKVKANYSFTKIDDKKIEEWAKDIEKLHRIDGYEYEVIQAVIDWSQEDDFWKQNIRSGSKLRKQFETLLVRIKSTPKRMEIIS